MLDANAQWSSAQRYACGVLLLFCARNVTPFTDYILQCGSVQWSCDESSGVTPTRILSQLNAKLNKLNKIEFVLPKLKRVSQIRKMIFSITQVLQKQPNR